MMKFRYLIITVIFLFIENVNAQADCILGVGVTEDAVITDIFQLNDFQIKNLEKFKTELKSKNDILNQELLDIKERHPQSSVTELQQLAEKYKAVMDSLGGIQADVDKRMLALFNPKQYELYQNLCKQAYRSPYVVVPTNYRDSIVNENR